MRSFRIENREEMEVIIGECRSCTVSMTDGNEPYCIPMSFVYNGGKVYLHSGKEGKKYDILRKNNRVCIAWSVIEEGIRYQDKEIGCSYFMRCRSVLAKGRVKFLDDDDLERKREILDLYMSSFVDYKVKYSDPAVRAVLIWEVDIEEMSGKYIGYYPDNKK